MGHAAVRAAYRAAQHEVFVKIGAGRYARTHSATVLDLLIGLQADDRFMLAFAHRDTPGRIFHVTSLNARDQQIGHPLG